MVGLDWERWRGYIDGKVVLWCVAALVALCAQASFGFVWSAYSLKRIIVDKMALDRQVYYVILGSPQSLKVTNKAVWLSDGSFR